MEYYDVYARFPVAFKKAKDIYVWDENDNQYLDLYGGHAVISIGHSHPYYIKQLTSQLNNIGYYSNSVIIHQQQKLAQSIASSSMCEDYRLFLINSGAESTENALKLASAVTGRKKIVSFSGGFHGRTNLALSVSDAPSIQVPISKENEHILLPLNDIEAFKSVNHDEVAAVIIEGLQGLAGIVEPDSQFMQEIDTICKEKGIKLVIDEVQSGFGRTGKFFAYQHYNIEPDIITFAKGCGNGFPVGGILVKKNIDIIDNILGSTFGGNYLACSAVQSVVDIINSENLVDNAQKQGEYLIEKLSEISEIKALRGKGLMIGLELSIATKEVRKILFEQYHILTGVAKGGAVIRLLPPLTIKKEHVDKFIDALKQSIQLVKEKAVIDA